MLEQLSEIGFRLPEQAKAISSPILAFLWMVIGRKEVVPPEVSFIVIWQRNWMRFINRAGQHVSVRVASSQRDCIRRILQQNAERVIVVTDKQNDAEVKGLKMLPGMYIGPKLYDALASNKTPLSGAIIETLDLFTSQQQPKPAE